MKIKIILTILSLILISACNDKQSVAPATAPAPVSHIPPVIPTPEPAAVTTTTGQGCPGVEACQHFEKLSVQCAQAKEPSVCREFVSIYKSLAPKDLCKRPIDNEPVSGVWSCSNRQGALDLQQHYQTLSKLNTPEARELL
jgi:hypothetical protein